MRHCIVPCCDKLWYARNEAAHRACCYWERILFSVANGNTVATSLHPVGDFPVPARHIVFHSLGIEYKQFQYTTRRQSFYFVMNPYDVLQQIWTVNLKLAVHINWHPSFPRSFTHSIVHVYAELSVLCAWIVWVWMGIDIYIFKKRTNQWQWGWILCCRDRLFSGKENAP